jgi:hypothetical protein
MQAKSAKRSESKHATVTLTNYDFTGGVPARARRIHHAVKDNVLIVSDDLAVVQGILDRWTDGKGGLAGLPAYQQVMARTQPGDKGPVHLRWFTEPIASGDVARVIHPRPKKEDQTWNILKNQGFDAIRGMGGFFRFASGDHDLFYRLAIHAPPPYTKAMRILRFPAGEQFAPGPWVPAQLSAYTTFYLDLPNAFDSFDTLFDQLAGEPDSFKEVIDRLKNDPNGPGVDIRKEILEVLAPRISVVTDLTLPVQKKSERLLLGIATTNEKLLADALRRSIQGDPNVRRRPFQDHLIWEILSKEAKPKKGAKEPPIKLPNSAMCAANGHVSKIPRPPGGRLG